MNSFWAYCQGLLGTFNFYVGLDIEMPFWNIRNFWKRGPALEQPRTRESIPLEERQALGVSAAADALAEFLRTKEERELAAAKAAVLEQIDNANYLSKEERNIIKDRLEGTFQLSWRNIKRAERALYNAQRRPADGGRRRTRRSKHRSRRTRRR